MICMFQGSSWHIVSWGYKAKGMRRSTGTCLWDKWLELKDACMAAVVKCLCGYTQEQKRTHRVEMSRSGITESQEYWTPWSHREGPAPCSMTRTIWWTEPEFSNSSSDQAPTMHVGWSSPGGYTCYHQGFRYTGIALINVQIRQLSPKYDLLSFQPNIISKGQQVGQVPKSPS